MGAAVSTFLLRWVWPIEDPSAFPSESLGVAPCEFADVAAARGVGVAGEAGFGQ